MDKAILVIDMPKYCFECPVCEVWEVIPSCEECCCAMEQKDITNRYNKPDWCPLKPLPEKMKGNDSIYYQWGDYEDGWNHCIDCITGE